MEACLVLIDDEFDNLRQFYYFKKVGSLGQIRQMRKDFSGPDQSKYSRTGLEVEFSSFSKHGEYALSLSSYLKG
jgi:hypothetical protein